MFFGQSVQESASHRAPGGSFGPLLGNLGGDPPESLWSHFWVHFNFLSFWGLKQ